MDAWLKRNRCRAVTDVLDEAHDSCDGAQPLTAASARVGCSLACLLDFLDACMHARSAGLSAQRKDRLQRPEGRVRHVP
eukprot:365808-Chlamydomonas_euryale.AAC.6